MDIRCQLVEKKCSQRLQPGDMFYFKNQQEQSQLVVVLPNGAHFNLTGAKDKWKVTGKAPKMTVTPSIFSVQGTSHAEWHGYLTNGVLSKV